MEAPGVEPGSKGSPHGRTLTVDGRLRVVNTISRIESTEPPPHSKGLEGMSVPLLAPGTWGSWLPANKCERHVVLLGLGASARCSSRSVITSRPAWRPPASSDWTQ